MAGGILSGSRLECLLFATRGGTNRGEPRGFFHSESAISGWNKRSQNDKLRGGKGALARPPESQARFAMPMTQRDKTRELARQHPRDSTTIIREYAQAERDGLVARHNNSRDMTPEDYASRLFADGIKKGWIDWGSK